MIGCANYIDYSCAHIYELYTRGQLLLVPSLMFATDLTCSTFFNSHRNTTSALTASHAVAIYICLPFASQLNGMRCTKIVYKRVPKYSNAYNAFQSSPSEGDCV